MWNIPFLVIITLKCYLVAISDRLHLRASVDMQYGRAPPRSAAAPQRAVG